MAQHPSIHLMFNQLYFNVLLQELYEHIKPWKARQSNLESVFSSDVNIFELLQQGILTAAGTNFNN